jgi:hypothetical protein
MAGGKIVPDFIIQALPITTTVIPTALLHYPPTPTPTPILHAGWLSHGGRHWPIPQ